MVSMLYKFANAINTKRVIHNLMRPLFPPSPETSAAKAKPAHHSLEEAPGQTTPDALLKDALDCWPLIQDELRKEISLEDYEHVIAPIKT